MPPPTSSEASHVGQQPNIELEIADLPRPVPVRGPERRWRAQRPGDFAATGEMPWGGAYGTIGPDAGYVLLLIRRRELQLAAGEHRHNAEVAVAALASARASHYGRAPTMVDVDVAVTLLGYEPEWLDPEVAEKLAGARSEWLANIGHEPAKRRALVASVPIEVLAASADELRRRMAAGELLFER